MFMSDYRSLFLKSFCLVTGLFLLSGCKDNNHGGTASSESPQVSSVMPADSAAGVSPDATVTAAFAEDMLGTSISERTVRLSRNGSDVPAGATFDGASNVVTLTPVSELGLLGHYQFTLDAAIANLSGNALSSPVTSSFTVRDGVWGETATSFNFQERNSEDVQVATGTDGHAIAVWVTDNGNPVSSRYTPEEGWSSPVNLDGGGVFGGKRYPQIAIDNEGNAIAVWQTYVNNGSYSLSANRYTKADGWGAAVTIGNAPIYLNLSYHNEKARLGFDQQGNALVLRAGLNYGPPGGFQVLVNRYSKQGGSWGGETPIVSNGSLELRQAQFTITADGSAFATWVQESSSSDCAIQTSRYAPGSGWTAAEIVGPGLCVSEPQIGADDEGNAIVVWNQPSGPTPNIWANRYSAGEGWGTARMIESDGEGTSRGPQIAVTPKGDALVVWRKNNGMSDRNRASRYSQQSDSWSQPENISAGDNDSVESPRLALDVDGNALAVWRRDINGKPEVRAGRYAVGSGWEAPLTITSDQAVPQTAVQVAVDSAGTGTVYWTRPLSSDSRIYSKRFD
jgi:hypothetical protein